MENFKTGETTGETDMMSRFELYTHTHTQNSRCIQARQVASDGQVEHKRQLDNRQGSGGRTSKGK